MNSAPNSVKSGHATFNKQAVEAVIRVGLLILIASACFKIILPFLVPMAWGMIIAVAVYPIYERLVRWLHGRHVLAAVVIVCMLVIALLVPSIILGATLVDGIQAVATHFQQGNPLIPPPPARISSWPVIGERLTAVWQLASTNLEAVLRQMTPYLKPVAKSLATGAAGIGIALVHFILAIVISGILLAYAGGSGRFVRALAVRVIGQNGADFADLAQSTVRSVTRGILGVAFTQATLIGLGFLVGGVPGAGLWALLCLIIGVAQLPMPIVQVPIVIYMFFNMSTTAFVIFVIWNGLCLPLDNILRPIFLGRGVKVPMAVIFIGSIGGLLAFGIIGLFLGAVIFAVAYKLFLAWLYDDTETSETGEAAATVLP